MKKTTYFSLLYILFSTAAVAQSVDDDFPKEKMRKDLQVFKEIRLEANSGLYKYRTKAQTDSIYQWAEREIENSTTYLDFYNIICQLTDFEGSLHNDTGLPEKYVENFRQETFGYFPYPIKWIDGKWLVNFENGEIPLGAEIVEINGAPIMQIIPNLYKYYTTDGQNTTGKRIGLRAHFSKFYRWHYGQQKTFQITYKSHGTSQTEKKTVNSVGYLDYYKRFGQRYSRPFDQIYYADLEESQKYSYTQLEPSIGLLTLYTFDMGNASTQEHKTYLAFLDSVFALAKAEHLQNLIVDLRQNGGGTDPNDLVTYSYLTQREFQENKQAWISFRKVPHLRYYQTKIPRFLRPIVARSYNRMFRDDFYLERDSRFYQGPLSPDHKIWQPNENAFTGKIYLLISPAVASAGSLCAAMLAGNPNTEVIGEETMGGYYGHNGHTPMEYVLPASNIETSFSVVNLEQDVPLQAGQIPGRGIIPTYVVSQTYDDYLSHADTQLEFALQWIRKKALD